MSNKITKYIDEDLDFIFIRAKNKKGKWCNISVRDLDKNQWESFLIRRYGNGKRFWQSKDGTVEKQEWTDEDKLGIINWLTEQGASFVMIARGNARKNDY